MAPLKDITSDLTKSALDAAYVAIGLGVIGFQKAQDQRQELADRLSEPREHLGGRLDDVRDSFAKQVKTVDSTVEEVIDRLGTRFAPFEAKLPDQARQLVKQARTQAQGARRQLRDLLLNAAA